MKDTLITLAALNYRLGLIGIDEYHERVDVALWLSDKALTKDPRYENFEREEELERDKESSHDDVVAYISNDEEEWLELIFESTWHFTKSDPDCYPSVPHGHYRNKNNKWPKLNPYTGRAFDAKHREERSKSLTKKQLKKLWSDPKFVSFCREFIVWYIEFNPTYFYRGI